MSSDVTTLMLIATAVLVVAFLYSSVGHAGASGYIAVMALAGMAPDVIKPAALVLNILVATIGSFQFWRAGHFRWHLFWPFALCAAPTAFLGGYLPVVPGVFRPLVGLVLLFSAARVLWQPDDPVTTRPPAVPVALGAGAGLGFLAGLTGTGGGIFLTP
ncbi:MAG TPA: sulfite exporter TauE/SafE family protein, partial [Fibrobacteria bacterium]|nr:sulfite exporter TauE/SafE family protein [Fibrobacteria bacterium]